MDFADVRPKYKASSRVMSSYANAVVDAIWDTKVLADSELAFHVVRSGKNISARMPNSQQRILTGKLFYNVHLLKPSASKGKSFSCFCIMILDVLYHEKRGFL